MKLLNKFFYFLLFAVIANIVLSIDDDYLYFNFSNAELNDLIIEEQKPNSKELDHETLEDTGLFINNFFHDSQTQLIIDLDIIYSIWNEINKYKKSAIEGDIDHIQVC